MDAIRSVETEVDNVLRLFSNCKQNCSSEIDKLLEMVDQSRQELDSLATPGQSELDSQQSNVIQRLCHSVQRSCLQITNSHRELHVPVTKIGKSIDRNFSADFAIISSKLFQSPENNKLLNLAVVQHLVRSGMMKVAEELIQEADLDFDKKEMDTFEEISKVLDSLRKKDSAPALKWAIKHRKRLRELNSPLEFKIHRINIIELYKQGVDKQHEIIQYARDNLQHLDPEYDLDIQNLMGGMIYLKTGLENSPYKNFLNPINFHEIEEIFASNACAMLDLSAKSPISVAVDAGSIALPALLNINQIISNQNVQNVWQSRDELPVEIDLGRNLQYHSTFSCPILKQQSTENNPPMKLVCGHVISRDALHKLCGNTAVNKLKCPYCPMEQVVSDAMQIHF